MSHTPIALQQFLYTSRVAKGLDFSIIPSILEVSRVRNRSVGISGVLVFDGERFAQWLEGPPAQVLALVARIEADPRHTDMRALFTHCRSGAERRTSRWSAGYADAPILDCLYGERAPQGDAARDRFASLLPHFDLST